MKDPAFLFYTKDFITGTMHMQPDEVGAYMRMLCYQHQHGSIPNDVQKIKRIIGVFTDEDFERIWSEISSKFVNHSINHLVNERLSTELEHRKNYRPKKQASACLAGLISSHKNLTREQINQIKKQFNINEFIQKTDDIEMKNQIKNWFNNLVNQMVNNIANANANNILSIEDKKGGVGENKTADADSLINPSKLPGSHKTQFATTFADIEPSEYLRTHHQQFYENCEARYFPFNDLTHFLNAFKQKIKHHYATTKPTKTNGRNNSQFRSIGSGEAKNFSDGVLST
jgi:uncharacterized protein YdaU (DUF1376 family)